MSELVFAGRSALEWLREGDAEALAALFRAADAARAEGVGPEVHLRGLVEVSSHCSRACWYCGLRAAHRELPRARLSAEQILAAGREAKRRGYGTLVLQAGEDPGLGAEFIAELIRRVRGELGLVVTLSLGERDERELELWREAGAGRYLVRVETSDLALFHRVHPGSQRSYDGEGREKHPRVATLEVLKRLGFEAGSGVLVGLPGQSLESLAGDIALFHRLDLDMVGIGPLVPHPATPLADAAPGSLDLAMKMVALARLACPEANIPATTAMTTLGGSAARRAALEAGANILMPNLTPEAERAGYEIYPNKANLGDAAMDPGPALASQLAEIGRTLGRGPGGRRRRGVFPA